MIRTRQAGWVLGTCAGLLALAVWAQEDEGLIMTLQCEKGEKHAVEISKSVKGKMTVTDDTGKRELKFQQVLEETFEEEILDAQDNMIRKVQRKYTTSVRQRQEPGMEKPEKKSTPIEGKTVTIERNSLGVCQYTMDSGPVPESEHPRLSLDADDLSFLLPGTPVKEGDRWSMSGLGLGAFFFREGQAGSASAQGECVLREGVAFEGQMCRKIEITATLDLVGKGTEPTTHITLTGAAYYDPEKHRIAGIDANGPLTVLASPGTPGSDTGLKIEGSGKVQLSYKSVPK